MPGPVFITGGTAYVGQRLTRALLSGGVASGVLTPPTRSMPRRFRAP